jgi:hypothetical protein
VAAFLSVLSSLLVGLLLVFVPWVNIYVPWASNDINLWENNYFVQVHPALRQLLLSNFVRGAVTGLGFVNLLLAVLETRDHVREDRGA